MSVLQSICKEMAVMENGRVECQGLVDTIFKEQPQELRNLLGDDHFQTAAIQQTTTINLLERTPDIVTQLVSDLQVDITITGRQQNTAGLTIQFPSDMYATVSEYLNTRHLAWEIGFQHMEKAEVLPN